MAEAPTAALELSTARQRSLVKIDDKSYELRHPDELSVVESYFMQELSKRLVALSKGEVSEKDLSSIQQGLDRSLRTAFVDLPESVLTILNDGQKLKVLEVFSQAREPLPSAQEPQTKTA